MPIHVIRYDDFSAASCTTVEEGLVELFLRLRIPCTFAVIPFVCDPAQLVAAGEVALCPLPESKAALLQPLLRQGLAEIALHGYCHLALAPVRGYQEFSDRMPEATQRELVRRGRQHLETVFRVPVRLYVPPWNRLARTTAAVLQEEGFALANDIRDGAVAEAQNLAALPSATGVAETDRALGAACRWGAGANIVGTMLHDYDFAESQFGGSTLKLAQFESLLAGWKQRPGVRHQLIGQAIDSMKEQGRERLEANLAFQNTIQRSRLGRRLLAKYRDVFWETRTARRWQRLVGLLP